MPETKKVTILGQEIEVVIHDEPYEFTLMDFTPGNLFNMKYPEGMRDANRAGVWKAMKCEDRDNLTLTFTPDIQQP
jgi:hypothetical protein